MKRLFKISVIILFLSPALWSVAQKQYEQSVRGTVIEKNTREPLAGALVVVFNGKDYGAVTDPKGEFVITGVPVGRCRVSASMLGFTRTRGKKRHRRFIHITPCAKANDPARRRPMR